MCQLLRAIELPDEDRTTAIARAIAPLLRAGDVLLLDGDIGAGKTFFARAMIRALTTPAEEVPSPTFTIVQVYEAPDFDIWHCDLYRLSSPEEALELGLDEAFETALCLIEWPARLEELAPKGALTVRLSPTGKGDARQMTFYADNPAWQKRLEELNV